MKAQRILTTLLVTAAMCAGCGGSSSPHNSPSRGRSSTATGSSAPAQNVAADKALAQGAGLKLSDFPPGWTSQPPSSAGSAQADAEIAKCLGVSVQKLNAKGPADVDSPDFSDSDNNIVSSTVGYKPSAAQAGEAFDLWSSPKVPRCLTTALASLINDQIRHPSNPKDTLPANVSVGTPTVDQMSFPTFGDRSIAYRASVPFHVQGLSPTVYADIIIASKGRAGVEMAFEGVSTPFPVDQEQHYTSLVVGRLSNT